MAIKSLLLTFFSVFSLAALINHAFPMPQANSATDKDDFPIWLSAGDERLLQSSTTTSNLVVAKDGTGNFTTIQQAIDAAAKRSGSGRFVIHVKRGVYEENILLGDASGLRNIMIVGDGLHSTIIMGNRSVVGGFSLEGSSTMAVKNDGFIGRGVTFRNTAGPQNGQAVALTSESNLSVFYQCRFEGYQDTLWVRSYLQFYRECDVYGTIDFIFGDAAAVFQNCTIYARRPMSGQTNVITAQGREDPDDSTGISIHNSRVLAAPDLVPVLDSVKTYLGRPWKRYSRTVFMQTYLDWLIDPEGWLPWNRSAFDLDTLYYGEYNNLGPRSSTKARIKWKGYHVIQSSEEALQFTVAKFIGGLSWLPTTGVPFTPYL